MKLTRSVLCLSVFAVTLLFGSSGASAAGSWGDWRWPMFGNWGIRKDAAGEGQFAAPRGQGLKHKGIDLLAPKGTALAVPCGDSSNGGNARFLSGNDPSGYGNWVQIFCPVPAALAGTAGQYFSILYAHLDSQAAAVLPVDTSYTNPRSIIPGTVVGWVGTTGNAGSANPHLHLDLVTKPSYASALAETHSSSDTTVATGTAAFVTNLKNLCLGTYGVVPAYVVSKKTYYNVGNAVDPWLVFFCMSRDKSGTWPDDGVQAYKAPTASLQGAGPVTFYSAANFSDTKTATGAYRSATNPGTLINDNMRIDLP